MQRRSLSRWFLALATLLVVVLLSATVAGLHPEGASAARCFRLPVYPGLAKGLHLARARTAFKLFKGPKSSSIRYGRCGRTYFAIAFIFDLRHPKGSPPGTHFGYQDGPDRFMRKRGHRWRNLGDTGGKVCQYAAPETLARAWGYGRTCD